jgi:F-type H+-transporting ATPase subunit a
MTGLLGLAFDKPTTKDFVFRCLSGSARVGGVAFCLNWVVLMLIIAVTAYLLLFFLAFRKPKVVPGKFQLIMESGLEFVRQQVVLQMIGPEGMGFLAFLTTLFFFIFLGNILEVIPGTGFPLNSRLAFPLVMALIAWVVYNAVGIRHHGFFGYLKLVVVPPGAPAWLLPFLGLIEFFSVIIVRPITLTLRLTANMIAGHFLLAVFFLGTLTLATGVPYVLGLVSFGLALLLVVFEIFVAGLQAFIFAVLTASYVAGAAASEH